MPSRLLSYQVPEFRALISYPSLTGRNLSPFSRDRLGMRVENSIGQVCEFLLLFMREGLGFLFHSSGVSPVRS